MTSLGEIRAEWEEGLTVVAASEQPELGRCLVVLKDRNGLYHCHRYFSIGGDWCCSVDIRGTSLFHSVIAWCFDPRGR